MKEKMFAGYPDVVNVDIQAWLGHSNYNTTANIYAHLESSSKEITGNAMQDNFTISANLAAREAVQE